MTGAWGLAGVALALLAVLPWVADGRDARVRWVFVMVQIFIWSFIGQALVADGTVSGWVSLGHGAFSRGRRLYQHAALEFLRPHTLAGNARGGWRWRSCWRSWWA